jgi:hypothetical protein
MSKEFRSNDFTLWEKSLNKKLDSIFQVSSELKFSLKKIILWCGATLFRFGCPDENRGHPATTSQR